MENFMRNIMLGLSLLISMSLSASQIESKGTSFNTVNVILGRIKSKLPEGCRIEKKEPIIVSRSPIIVNYQFNLIKGSQTTSIVFEQSQDDFLISSDNQTFEEIRSLDNKLVVRLNAQEEVTFVKVNDLECSL
jgi:hypothetical protein